MHISIFSSVIQAMADQGVTFQQGLTEEEISKTEILYSLTFPPDLKAFLSLSLPVAEGFVNWRTASKDEILYKLQLPFKVILSKVKYHDYWLESWGKRPCESAMAYEVALGQLQSQPKLIPIYQYSYLPEAPHEAGNPVLSVNQSKMFYESADLIQFLIKNFQVAIPEDYLAQATKRIPYWHQIVE